MLNMIIAIAAGALVIVGYLVFSRVFNKRRHSQELTGRIRSVDDELFSDEKLSTEVELDNEKSNLAHTLDGVSAMIMMMLGKNVEEELVKLRKQMLQGGITSPDMPSYYLFYQYIGRVVVLLLAIPFLKQGASAPLDDLVVGLILLVVGLFGHKLYLKNAIDKRRTVLLRSFPDALDLMLVCVESGLSLDAAFARVCNELGSAHPVITAELNRTRMELAMMSDRSKAIHALGERVGLTAFKALSAALIQSEKFGTSLADTLRVMSDDYRQTRLLMAENKANRLPALMTIPLITMLLPAMFIIIMAPAIIGVMDQGGLFGNGGQ